MNQLEIENKAMKSDNSNLNKDVKRHEMMHPNQADSLRTQANEIKDLKTDNLISLSRSSIRNPLGLTEMIG